MKKELKFKQIIDDIISEINIAKMKSTSIHKVGNIRSSGAGSIHLIYNFSLFLPKAFGTHSEVRRKHRNVRRSSDCWKRESFNIPKIRQVETFGSCDEYLI